MLVKTVMKINDNYVVIELGNKNVHIAKIDNRAIIFSKTDHHLYVTYVSRDYGNDTEELHNKFLRLVAKMVLKDKDSKYFNKADQLHFRNGNGAGTISQTEKHTIYTKAYELVIEAKGKKDNIRY